MDIVVAAFFADVLGAPSRLNDYLPLIEASRKALELTNPGAKYVVITDGLTAPGIEKHADVWIADVPAEAPLLTRLLRSQVLFTAQCDADLLCLPDIDCFANRDLSDATPEDLGLAITHKGEKFGWRINNLAYIRDPELGAWFLDRAVSILMGWTREAQEWWGDQEAWGWALGTQVNGLGLSAAYIPLVQFGEPDAAGERTFVARPAAGRYVYVYPCRTHNCPLADDGIMRPMHHDAYFVHLKGPRKQHVDRFMAERFGCPTWF